jgi:ribosome biogenesis GTPase
LSLQRNDLGSLGWDPDLAADFRPYADAGLTPARVVAQHRGVSVLSGEEGELWAETSGRLRHAAASPAELPATGDWVGYRTHPGGGRSLIDAVLPRRTAFTRNATDLTRPRGAAAEQVIAANMDVVLVVTALVGDLSVRRLERYLATAWDSGATPAVVLTKLDLCGDLPRALAEVERVALGVPLLPISNVTGEGVEDVRSLIGPGRTAALLGSSGVGKSSLVNRLLGGDVQAVREIRQDGRGRHTTTHRELFMVSGGGLVLDTPGLRVLRLLDAGEGLSEAFSDVERLAERCRFSDCAHDGEPGCAVAEAIDSGSLEPGRLEAFRRLHRELAFIERKGDKRAEAEQRRRRKAIQREQRRRVPRRDYPGRWR